MELYPATIVHGLAGARAALAKGKPVTLLSADGAGLYMGCGWWKALIDEARAAFPEVPLMDVLDCADGTGQALGALRLGLTRLVLRAEAPGRDAVISIAQSLGAHILTERPPVHMAGSPSNGDKPRRPG